MRKNLTTCFLVRNFFLADLLSSKSTGKTTLLQYLRRGLRQGCNLSSILFIIYVTELADRLEQAGVGSEICGRLLNSLFFADDIVLVAESEEDMRILIAVVEKWCQDFKMKVSIKKTQIVGAAEDSVWVLKDLEMNEESVLKIVPSYEYLGIWQYKTAIGTARNKATEALKKMKSYRGLISMQKFFIPYTISSFLAIWNNILLPSVLYGLDVIPVPKDILDEFEIQQYKVEKLLMGVPQSTANVSTNLVLGMKPMTLRILNSKLRFIKRISSLSDDRLVRRCWDYHKSEKNTWFWRQTSEIFATYSIDLDNLPEDAGTLLEVNAKMNLLHSAGMMKSMLLVEIPKIWWRRPLFVQIEEWSRTLVRFILMNAGIANRSGGYQDYAVTLESGRVVLCLVCSDHKNDEVHILTSCRGNVFNLVQSNDVYFF